MAEMITLREYLNELRDKLNRGMSAEVISHCRYILQNPHWHQHWDQKQKLGLEQTKQLLPRVIII